MTELFREDYEEPRCVLCMDSSGSKSIPIARIIELLDRATRTKDYAEAERICNYWKQEAQLEKDTRGLFSLCNEQMGIYRKTGKKAEAIACAEEALHLISVLENENSLSAATCYVNAATVFDAFEDPERSLPLFEKACAIYESSLSNDARLGSLYNNMALSLVALQRYEEADTYYNKAKSVMSQIPGSEAELAITCLNQADAIEARQGSEVGEREINRLLDEAETLLSSPALPHDSHYAFVCEKCAPVFRYYGYFSFAATLEHHAKEIYERA